MTERDREPEDHLAEVLQRLCESDENVEDIGSSIDDLSELELADLINAGHCADLLHQFYETGEDDDQSVAGTIAFAKGQTTDSTEASDQQHGKKPRTIGRFRIIESIAKGGFAEIYKAFDSRIERHIALKVPYPHLIEDDSFRSRFECEARAVGTLSHPAIVSVFEACSDEGQVYLALEWVPGVNLREFLKENDCAVPARHAAMAINHLAQAVGHAHRRGILHRDLKPANVLLDSRRDEPWHQRLMVTDFGLAKVIDAEEVREALTAEGALLGTAAYMSPEQIEGKPVPQTDVFALGTMLYELLAGQLPFKRDSFAATIRSIENDSVPRIENLAARKVPAELSAICYKCLEKEPERRYSDATELSADLERYLNGLPIRARQASWFDVFKKWARRNPAVATCLAITFSTLLVAVLLISQALRDANRKSVELKKQISILQTILEDLDDNQEGVLDQEFQLRDRLAKRLVTCSDQILELSTDAEGTSDLMASLGKALVALGFSSEASNAMDQAITKTIKLNGSADDVLRLKIQRAFATKDSKKALQQWDMIIDDVKRSEGISPRAKAQALYNQAEATLFAGKLEQSRSLYLDAIEHLSTLALPEHAKKQLEGMATFRLSRIDYLQSPGKKSLASYRAARDEFASNYRLGHRHVAAANNELIIAYLQNNEFDPAFELADLNFSQTRENYGLGSIHTMYAVEKILIASCRTLDQPESKKRLEDSVRLMEQYLPILVDKHGIENANLIPMTTNLARAYSFLGQPQNQVQTLERLVDALDKTLGSNSDQTLKLKAVLEAARAVD